MNIVLVSVGNFQEYILTNIKQLINLGHKNIYVITDFDFFEYFNEYKNNIILIKKEDLIDNYDFENKSNLNKDFRNKFWLLTSNRFFYIYSFMKLHNIDNVIHLENDVLIYYNCDDTLYDKLDKQYIYMPFDSFDRNIASIVFIPNYNILNEVLDNYDFSKNDMENFSIIQKKCDNIKNFPIYINNSSMNDEYHFVTSNFDNFEYIFDAAAIGQYLGGVDPRNITGDTQGFINETCIIKYNNDTFIWENNKPFIIINDIKYPIFNLHIHCKNLNSFINKNKIIETCPDLFDIIIPLGPNDINVIHEQIKYNKKNIIGYRNIYIISFDKNISIDGCITIDENIFPFSKNDIENICGKSSRSGWILQQLLKLYAVFIIPDILETVLIIDSDTFFLKPTIFISNDNKKLYCTATEYNDPYFVHMKKLNPNLERVQNCSGIVHHMIFEKRILIKLFESIENIHNDEFWIVFLKCITDATGSCASEYEIYFNYILKYNFNEILIRNLKRNNCLYHLDQLINENNVDVVSIHWYNMSNY